MTRQADTLLSSVTNTSGTADVTQRILVRARELDRLTTSIAWGSGFDLARLRQVDPTAARRISQAMGEAEQALRAVRDMATRPWPLPWIDAARLTKRLSTRPSTQNCHQSRFSRRWRVRASRARQAR